MATLLSLASLAIAAGLARRVNDLERSHSRVEHPVLTPERSTELPNALAGLHVQLQITQDHPLPVFSDLLKAELSKFDVAEVSSEPGDLTISGRVVCNGYSEMYFDADLTCALKGLTVCAVLDRPPGGDRQANLAMDLAAKLNRTLADRSTQTERRQALKELER